MQEVTYYQIYGLRIKGSHKVKYIGCTKKDLIQRLRGHFKENKHNSKKNEWVSLYKNHIEIFSIEKGIPCLSLAYEREKFYIQEYRERGHDLLNISKGGQGTNGVVSWNKGVECQYIDRLIDNSPKSKKIYAYDLNGVFVKEFRSVKFASKETGSSRAFICNCANLKPKYKQSKGLTFRWFKSENIPRIDERRKGYTITCIDTLIEYPSVAFAARELGVSLVKMLSITKNKTFYLSDLKRKNGVNKIKG